MKPSLPELATVETRWAKVAELVAANDELCDAIREVLTYEQERIGVTAEMPEAVKNWQLGVREGIGLAFGALTDHNYIREVRGMIEDELKEAQA